MTNGQASKYYITRRKGSRGLYLTARPRTPECEIQRAGGRQGLPSSVSMPTPASYPQSQQTPSPSPPEFYDLDEAESRQPVLRRAGSRTIKTRPTRKCSQLDTNVDTRRVRFSLPEEPDVAYPGAHANLRVLREQFDGIQEEERATAYSREASWQEKENQRRLVEPAIVSEYSSSRRQEQIPRGILKNWSPAAPANPSQIDDQEQSLAPKSFFYSPSPQNDGLSQEYPQPIRFLRILRPPPLPEGRDMYESERKAVQTNRHVRFVIRPDDAGGKGPSWDNSPPPPPLPQRQDSLQQNVKGRHEPIKPLAAYVRSEEEEEQDQQNSVAW